MKIQKIVVLFLLLNAGNASAVFLPAPIEEEKPMVIDFGIDPKMYFSPTYKLKHFGVSVAAARHIWRGFEVGAQLRGGLNDNSNGLFSGGSTYTGDLGGDVMARYLVTLNHFYFGLQTVFGYDYFFNSANTLEQNSFMNLAFGVPLGAIYHKVVAYVMPTLELGIRNTTDTGAWGSLVSGSLSLGTKIDVGGPWLIVEFSPRIDDFANSAKTTGLKTFLGMGWDI